MSARKSRNIVAPRYRHFFPTVVDQEMSVPFFDSNAGGLPTQVVDYVATNTGSFALPVDIVPQIVQRISIFFQGVAQPNEYGVIGTGFGPSPFYIPYPIYGWSNYDYYAATNTISYREPPKVGDAVKIVINLGTEKDQYFPIEMEKYLIQGSNPVDVNIISNEDDRSTQFQGAFRCVPEIMSKAFHGSVRITAERTGIEYRPDLGYLGKDSFSYRVVNALGQESEAKCVTVYVGISAAASKAADEAAAKKAALDALDPALPVATATVGWKVFWSSAVNKGIPGTQVLIDLLAEFVPASVGSRVVNSSLSSTMQWKGTRLGFDMVNDPPTYAFTVLASSTAPDPRTGFLIPAADLAMALASSNRKGFFVDPENPIPPDLAFISSLSTSSPAVSLVASSQYMDTASNSLYQGVTLYYDRSGRGPGTMVNK